jgi:predicted Zn-dependent protease with MMP-like domain
MTLKKDSNFKDKAINSMPKFVWGFLGTFIGVALTLQMTGYNGSINRILEAYVKSIEKSADSLEKTTANLISVISRIENVEIRTTNNERDILMLKQHQAEVDAKFHRSLAK